MVWGNLGVYVMKSAVWISLCVCQFSDALKIVKKHGLLIPITLDTY